MKCAVLILSLLVLTSAAVGADDGNGADEMDLIGTWHGKLLVFLSKTDLPVFSGFRIETLGMESTIRITDRLVEWYVSSEPEVYLWFEPEEAEREDWYSSLFPTRMVRATAATGARLSWYFAEISKDTLILFSGIDDGTHIAINLLTRRND